MRTYDVVKAPSRIHSAKIILMEANLTTDSRDINRLTRYKRGQNHVLDIESVFFLIVCWEKTALTLLL